MDSSDLIRHGIGLMKDYLSAQRPDPHAAELALFDQVVNMRIACNATAEQAIQDALTIVRARREFAKEDGRKEW
jgi:hypothetical protein